MESFWKLRDAVGDCIKLVYYEDFCADFPNQVRDLFAFLEVPFSDVVLRWHELPHHDASGRLRKDLKYRDSPVFDGEDVDRPCDVDMGLLLQRIGWQHSLWRERKL